MQQQGTTQRTLNTSNLAEEKLTLNSFMHVVCRQKRSRLHKTNFQDGQEEKWW